MNFLNPGILSLLSLGGIPILIHLIHRRRAVERPFAAFEFLLKSQSDTVRRFRLRSFLLLLIRTLFVLSVVTAAALPVLFGGARGAGPERGGVLAILDNSASMGYREEGRSGLEAGRAFLAGYVSRENIGRVKIFPLSGDSVETGAGEGEEAVRRKIESVRQTFRAGNFAGALGRVAANLGRRGGGWEEVVIVSDFLEADWRGAADSALLAAGIPVSLADAGPDSARQNAGLTGWTLVTGASLSDPHLRLTVEFLNAGSSPASNLPLTLSMAGRSALNGFVGAGPGQAVQKEFLLDAAEKMPPGTLKIPEDALAFDNTRYFAFSPPPPMEILIVDGDQGMHYTQSEAFFLERALSDPAAGRLPFKVVTPLGLDAKSLERRRVVFVCNHIPGAAQAAALRTFVEQGGGLFLSLGDRVSPQEFNDRLSGLFQRTLRDKKSGFGHDSAVAASLTVADPGHPAVQLLNGIDDPSLYQFRNVYLLEPSPGAGTRTLLSLSTGEPLLLSVNPGRGKALLYLSSLDMDWNDFPLRPFYLPFVREAVRFLGNAREVAVKDTVRAGDTLMLTVPPGKGPLTVEGPDGRRHFPAPEGGTAKFPATELPGLYKITGREKEPEWAAVNVAPAESEGQRLTGERIAAVFAGCAVERIAVRQGEKVRGRKPLPLFRFALIFAAALALAEGALAGEKNKGIQKKEQG